MIFVSALLCASRTYLTARKGVSGEGKTKNEVEKEGVQPPRGPGGGFVSMSVAREREMRYMNKRLRQKTTYVSQSHSFPLSLPLPFHF